MRVLVAGAGGAIGRPLTRQLVDRGHVVIGLTRSAEKATVIRSLGAEVAIADALDLQSVRRAVGSARPDVIVHEMTDLKGASDLRRFDRTFAVSNRLRTVGLDHLLAAGREVGVKRFVAQSYCGWPYARTGGPIKTEGDPLDPAPPRELRGSLEAIKYLETTVTASGTPTGVVLRYGSFYGPNTGMLEPAFLDQVRRRRVPLIGDGNGWWSFVHVEDAAAATALAVEAGDPGIYNVVDDDPARVREWLPELARLVGARAPLHVPAWLARVLGGRHLVVMMTEGRAGSNAKARHDLGWIPKYSSWRRGFAEALRNQRTGATSVQHAA